jgi:serine/threonine-protein kinase
MTATDPVTRLNEALAGRYVIERKLGAGGMATVYLARDLKHDRRVALKVLKPELAAVLGAERFVQEIKTTASLQHPHILPLFDSGRTRGMTEGLSDDFLYYVMPYIEGETLRDRLNRETQLGVDEAVRITREVADALDYAHRHGVIHRDIKPENILLHDGRPMVADFGIALAVSAAAGGRMTETGLSLGTPHYMSPEQATADKEITSRADIYSLGCVLYEMLSGNPPHIGATAQQIIMKIVLEPAESVTKVRKSVPLNVAAAVARAIEKLPADRFETAKAFADALANPNFSTTNAGAIVPAPLALKRGVSPWWLALAVGVAAVALAGWLWSALRATPPVQRARFTVAFGDSARLRTDEIGVGLTISRDGSHLAWVGGSPTRQIYVRALDDLVPKAVPGSESAKDPQFSPDGKWLAFVLSGRLLRVPLAGGPVSVIADRVTSYSWGEGDVIVFAGNPNSANAGLWRVSAAGGRPERLVQPDSARGEAGDLWPHFLPGGKAVVFEVRLAIAENDSLAVVRLSDGRVTRLGIQGNNPRYAVSGHLLFGRIDGTVTAVRFDPGSFKVSGPEVAVLESVICAPGGVAASGAAAFDLASNGTLVYAQKRTEGHLVLVDRQGTTRLLRPEIQPYANPRFSPDGTRLALTIRGVAGSSDIWIENIAARTLTRFTTDGVSDRPGWTADGRRIGWRTKGDSALFDVKWAPSDGSGTPELLVRDGWSAVFVRSGDRFFTNAVHPATAGEIDLVSLDSARHRTVFQNTRASEFAQKVSPDGNWVAFMSDQSGVFEVYVRAVSGPTGIHQITTDGGVEPVWAPSGLGLYYRSGAKIMSATITTTPDFAVAQRDTVLDDVFQLGTVFANYDVSPDGRNFVMVQSAGGETPPVIVLGWLDELRERMKQATR